REEHAARLAVGQSLSGEAQEAMFATTALLAARIDPDAPTPWVTGESTAVRVVNFDLSPPGCDPRRRAAALADIDGVFGEDAAIQASSLSGWSYLVASD